MKPANILSYALAGVLSGLAPFAMVAAAADLADSDPNNVRAASVYIQSVGGSISSASQAAHAPAPALLAEIRYDVLDPSTAQVVAYEPPEDEEDGTDGTEDASGLYRIGLYDPRSKEWIGGTSVTAGSNFAKGYSPQFILTVAGSSYVGVSVRGVAIDAGATRDFGPQALVVAASKGATPVLNRPVVLNPEGKKAAPPEEEKSFLQKYWWAMALALVMVATTGGGDEK